MHVSNFFRLLGVMLVVAWSCLNDVHAFPTLNPKTYASPSGEYALRVEPSSPDGNGSASYRMTRAGAEEWAREHEFTLWHAKVTDDGRTVGVAYNGGLQGIFTTGPNEPSILMIVVLGPDGGVHWIDREERRPPPFSSNPPAPLWPTASALFVVPERSSFAVIPWGAEEDDHRDRWWLYHLVKRGRQASVVLDEAEREGGGFRDLAFIEPVPGTPLVLLHWLTRDYGEANQRRHGAQFSVLTLHGPRVWGATYENEYAEFGDRFRARDLRTRGYEQAGVSEGVFWIHSFEAGQRLSFRIHEDAGAPDGWRVEESGREAGRPKPSSEIGAELAPIERVTLRELGRIELQRNAREPSPIEDLWTFAPDGEAGFGVLHVRREPGRLVLTLVDKEGNVVAEHDITPPGRATPHATRTADGRWVLHQFGKRRDAENSPRAWIFDPAAGEMIERPLPDVLDVYGAVHLLSSDLLVGVGVREGERQPEILAVDARGSIAWSTKVGGSGDLEHFTVTTREEIVALERFPAGLLWLNARGDEIRRINLELALGRKPNYPSGVFPGLGGGVVFHDFNGSPPVHQFDLEGELIGSFHPAHADGRRFRIHGGVRAGPDGRLWTSDGHALFRLDANGVVESILGPPPGGEQLDHISAMTVDQDGFIYAVNARDGVVHKFDRSGMQILVTPPGAGDFEDEFRIGENLTIDGDGTLYLHEPLFTEPSKGYLRFSSRGERLGFEQFKFDQVSEHWFFKPGTNERWVVGYQEIRLLDGQGEIIKRIRKRSTGDWLGTTDEVAVAPDGSLAVVVTGRGMGWNQPHYLCIFDPAGNPRATWDLGTPLRVFSMSFDGSSVFVGGTERLLLVDAKTGARVEADYPSKAPSGRVWEVVPQPKTDELWLHRGDDFIVRRFEVSR